VSINSTYDSPKYSGHKYSIDDLLAVMARLRDPERGCPWDLQQNFATIAPHTLEECYELVDAIERGDFIQVREELGDVLFQVIFYAQMGHELGQEQGRFEWDELVDNLVEKLVRRHPHVFPSGTLGENDTRTQVDVEQVHQTWERIKQIEREAKLQGGVLDDVPLALPALSRAAKLQKRAARVGFDWKNWQQVLEKIQEEQQEVVEAIDSGDAAAIEDEIGDLLFACVNLARFVDIDPETALRGANRKFERRFRFIESELAAIGQRPEESSLDAMEQLWIAAKRAERKASS
jgi:ATP diphosphatase